MAKLSAPEALEMEESGEKNMQLKGYFWHHLQQWYTQAPQHICNMHTEIRECLIKQKGLNLLQYIEAIKLFPKALPFTEKEVWQTYQIPRQRGLLHWRNLWNNFHSLVCYCWTSNLRHRLWLPTGQGARHLHSSSPTNWLRVVHSGK